MPAPRPGQVYHGDTRLYIVLDIGNTSSAVAYLWLQKDQPIPNVCNVNCWPGKRGEDKIPSVVLVSEDPELKILKFGRDAISAFDGSPGTRLIQNFKLDLHPKHMRDAAMQAEEGDAVFERPGETLAVVQCIYKSFVKCLLDCTKQFFKDTVYNGEVIWDQAIRQASFRVGVPNGWLEPQKAVLKQALLDSGYCTSVEQVTAISEGEASFYYLLNLSSQPVPRTTGDCFLVVDCGGSTIDSNVLQVVDFDKVKFREIEAPKCWQRGGEFVTRGLLKYTKDMLRRMLELPEEHIETMLEELVVRFEEGTKTTWDGTDTQAFVGCAAFGFNAPQCNIKRGKIAIPGAVLNNIFECCVGVIVKRIVDIIESSERREKATKDENEKRKVKRQKLEVVTPSIKHVLLVGGFGESLYLRRRLEHALAGFENVALYKCTTENPGTKAVSAGDAWGHLEEGSLVSRGAVFHFGVETVAHYVVKDHRNRPFIIGADGRKQVDDLFHPIVLQGQPSAPEQFTSFGFQRTFEEPPELKDFRVTLYACTLDGKPPKYMRDTSEDRNVLPHFVPLGDIIWGRNEDAGLPTKACLGRDGKTLYKLDFQIGVAFGGLNIQARIEAPKRTYKGVTLSFATVITE